MVGSRNATQGDLDFAHKMGGEAAEAGYSIVSGGARGIDESAMLGALEKEGTVIGVLSDRLLKAATSSKYRPALMARNLVLMSPFNPEAGFDVGNAMARNKYVYCLADAAVIVHSGTTGGTWSGALENLKHGWVPMWVKPTDDLKSGNAQIVAKGARWLPGQEGKLDTRQLFERQNEKEKPPRPGSVFDPPVIPTKTAVGEDQSGFERETAAETVAALDHPTEAAEPPEAEVSNPAGAEAGTAGADVEGEAHTADRGEWEACHNMSFYEFFLRRMETPTGKEPKTIEQLLGELDISKTQLAAWLKRAVSEKHLRKLSKPVRYAWLAPEPKPKQASIF
jgi:predicted Rossmann fold nucleotide-binding protein DprA/Smf involved in DNA uptake